MSQLFATVGKNHERASQGPARCWCLSESGQHFGEEVRGKLIVVVEESHPLALRGKEATIASMSGTRFGFIEEEEAAAFSPSFGLVVCYPSSGHLSSGVGRCIVYE